MEDNSYHNFRWGTISERLGVLSEVTQPGGDRIREKVGILLCLFALVTHWAVDQRRVQAPPR